MARKRCATSSLSEIACRYLQRLAYTILMLTFWKCKTQANRITRVNQPKLWGPTSTCNIPIHSFSARPWWLVADWWRAYSFYQQTPSEFGTAWASVWWTPFSHRKFRAFNFQNQVCALPRCIWLQVQNSPLEEQLQIFACPSSPIHEPTQTLSVFSLPQDIGHFPTTWTGDWIRPFCLLFVKILPGGSVRVECFGRQRRPSRLLGADCAARDSAGIPL